LHRKGFPWGAAAAAASLLIAAGVVWKARPRETAPESDRGLVRQQFTPPPVPEPKPVDPPVRPPQPVPPPADPVPPAPEPDPVVPRPPDPEPPPVTPPEPVEPDAVPRPPTRALGAVRLLDVTGKLFLGKTAVAEGLATDQLLSAPQGAGFHAAGRLIVLAPGASASVGLDGDTLVLDVNKGDTLVRALGGAVRCGDIVLESGRWVVLRDGKVEDLAALEPKIAAQRTAKFAKFTPTATTLVFEDFASREDGFARATVQGGGIVGAVVPSPAGVAWSGSLRVRFRARTSAATLQIGMRFRGRFEPWAAMLRPGDDGWTEFTARGADFSAGPSGGAAPGADQELAEITFAVNTSEPGSSGASLDIDDVVLILENGK
jgi:hypothetical protein